jgi:tetratricopeptide (TPR) repeat protein
MQTALEQKKDNLQIYFMLSQLFEESKKIPQAIDVLKKADLQFAHNSQVNYFLGTLYDRTEQKELMLRHMRLAVSYDDKNYQAMNYVAYSLAERGSQLDEAEVMAQKAYSLQQEDPFIIDTLGWVYYKKGDFQKALPLIEKAHQLSPDVAIIAEHLGDVYAKLNKDSKAKNAYLKAQDQESDRERLKILRNKITVLEKQNGTIRSPAQLTPYEP